MPEPENTTPAPAPVVLELPTDVYRGHVFHYRGNEDLFACGNCQEYEFVARRNAATGEDITVCPGLLTWRVDGGTRSYLAVTIRAEAVDPSGALFHVGDLKQIVTDTGVAQVLAYGYSAADNTLLIITSPSHVSAVATAVRQPHGIRGVIAGAITPLSREEALHAQRVNYTAFVARYGAPR